MAYIIAMMQAILNLLTFSHWNVYIFSYLFKMIAEVMIMREEEKKQSSRKMKIRSMFKKRWVFPAIYLVSAALVIIAVFWFQSANRDHTAQDKYNLDSNLLTQENMDEPAVEVSNPTENFKMPVKNPENAVIEKEFYDKDASKEKQQEALIVYKNSYYPNRGIDIVMKDGKEFKVLAAMSGTVANVQEDSLLGNTLLIEHEQGVTTQYQSVKDIKVEVGDQVKQGQILATASNSAFHENAGIHVHFEIRKDDIPVDPISYFNKPITALVEKVEDVEEQADKDEQSVEEKDPQDADSTPKMEDVDSPLEKEIDAKDKE